MTNYNKNSEIFIVPAEEKSVSQSVSQKSQVKGAKKIIWGSKLTTKPEAKSANSSPRELGSEFQKLLLPNYSQSDKIKIINYEFSVSGNLNN